jgi:hypothetical protein
VSSTKLVLLTATTAGLYEFWWMHRNWMALRDRFGERVSPFWRTLLRVFTSYSLFSRLEQRGRQHGLALAVWPGALAIAYALAFVAGQTTAGLLAFTAGAPLLPANALARRLNQTLAPNAPAVVGWSKLNVIWLIFAALALWLVLTAAR